MWKITKAFVVLFAAISVLQATEEPQFIFEGQVGSVDAPLTQSIQVGDVLSGILTFKALTPRDMIDEAEDRGKYEDFLLDAEATLDRHYVALLSSRYDSDRAEACHTSLGQRDQGLPQTLAYAIPLKSGFKSDRDFIPVWLEFWLYDTRGQMLPDDSFPAVKPAFEAGTFRITFQGPAESGMAFISGSVSRFGPPQDESYDAEAEIAELERIVLELNGIITQQKVQLEQMNARIEEERSRQRYMEEQLRQAQAALENVVTREEADTLAKERDEATRIAEKAELEAATARDNVIALEIDRAQMTRRNETLNLRNEALQSALITAQQEAERWRETALLVQQAPAKAVDQAPASEAMPTALSAPATQDIQDEYGVLVIRNTDAADVSEEIPVRLKPLIKERTSKISRPGTRRYPSR